MKERDRQDIGCKFDRKEIEQSKEKMIEIDGYRIRKIQIVWKEDIRLDRKMKDY